MHSIVDDLFSEDDRVYLREIVTEIARHDAAIAAAEAGRIRALARAGKHAQRAIMGQRPSVREHDMLLRSISAEIAVASHASDRSVQRQIGEAITLVDDFPRTLSTWESGHITRAHVRAVVDAGTPLPSEQRAEFDARAAEQCRADSPARVKPLLERLAEELHPRTLDERHAAARETRCVRVVAGVDGMSDLIATLPTLLADAIYDRLTQQARVIADTRTTPPVGIDHEQAEVIASDIRTTDQIRADLFADMLLTAGPGADPTRTDDGPGTLGAIRAKVQIIVPALTLLGADTQPADLVGRSPIDPETARRLAAATTVPWDRVLTHPVTGAVLHTDTYQRTTAIDRMVRARDQHCRFPGCRAPAIRCEVDHTVDYARGGKTTVCNLACLCQRHHTMKQFTAWRVRQLPGGVLEWTSPLGVIYIDFPSPPPGATVRFTPDADEQPAF